jgi:alkylation response protein AidB-like acyl-CoA dehydrogenase
MRLRWGLWRGNTLLASGRRVWLDGYRRQLHGATWSALVDSLRTLPELPRPTDDYGRDYGMLKAYLVMTGESPRSTPEFLAPMLLTSWARGQSLDAAMTALARRQFDFYAVELARENLWPQAADAGDVGAWLEGYMFSLAGPIYAGTNEIQRNIIAERLMKLPRA